MADTTEPTGDIDTTQAVETDGIQYNDDAPVVATSTLGQEVKNVVTYTTSSGALAVAVATLAFHNSTFSPTEVAAIVGGLVVIFNVLALLAKRWLDKH